MYTKCYKYDRTLTFTYDTNVITLYLTNYRCNNIGFITDSMLSFRTHAYYICTLFILFVT